MPPPSTLTTSTLLATQELQPRLVTGQLTPAGLVRIALDPVIALAVLAAALRYFGEPFGGHYLILMVLVFSLTFPGSAPARIRRERPRRNGGRHRRRRQAVVAA